jgi:hypothetical protein
MMTSRRAAAGPRPLQRGKKQNPMQQYLLIGGISVALVIAVVMLMTSRKPAAAAAPRTGRAPAGATAERKSKPVRPAPSVARTGTGARDRNEQRREERRRGRERDVTRTTGGRTARRDGGSVARSRNNNPYQLKAILVDEGGARYALVGDRRLKAGDDVGGRKLVEVGVDAVKVNNGVSVYTVKVGEAIY